MSTTSDGLRVLEAELEGDQDVDVIWVHTNADLTPFGFQRRDGYVRLHADRTPEGEALPPLPEHDYADVLHAAYLGLWGHKLVSSDARPPEGCVVVGLESVGLCRVFPASRLIDAPGLRAGHRTVANYVRLLLGGCAALGPGPADVESWGDAPEVIAAYRELGFELAEQVGGWELLVKAPPRSDRRPT